MKHISKFLMLALVAVTSSALADCGSCHREPRAPRAHCSSCHEHRHHCSSCHRNRAERDYNGPFAATVDTAEGALPWNW